MQVQRPTAEPGYLPQVPIKQLGAVGGLEQCELSVLLAVNKVMRACNSSLMIAICLSPMLIQNFPNEVYR